MQILLLPPVKGLHKIIPRCLFLPLPLQLMLFRCFLDCSCYFLDRLAGLYFIFALCFCPLDPEIFAVVSYSLVFGFVPTSPFERFADALPLFVLVPQVLEGGLVGCVSH